MQACDEHLVVAIENVLVPLIIYNILFIKIYCTWTSCNGESLDSLSDLLHWPFSDC